MNDLVENVITEGLQKKTIHNLHIFPFCVDTISLIKKIGRENSQPWLLHNEAVIFKFFLP